MATRRVLLAAHGRPPATTSDSLSELFGLRARLPGPPLRPSTGPHKWPPSTCTGTRVGQHSGPIHYHRASSAGHAHPLRRYLPPFQPAAAVGNHLKLELPTAAPPIERGCSDEEPSWDDRFDNPDPRRATARRPPRAPNSDALYHAMQNALNFDQTGAWSIAFARSRTKTPLQALMWTKLSAFRT